MTANTCGCTTETCGCCEGVQAVTPMPTANHPGLNSLSYRIGTHGAFLETMKARIASLGWTLMDPAGQNSTSIRPLSGLTARDASDPAIALLDSWATVADVLTFYQERIANEGYLRTATERRSVLELARLVGYSLRPGVAASVYLAYTVDDNQKEPVIIAPGARAQSIAFGPGELPQTFETGEQLLAKAEWSNLQARVTQPQVITPSATKATLNTDTLYFQGVSTGLKANDPLLINFDTPVVLYVKALEADFPNNRTKVILIQPATPTNIALTQRPVDRSLVRNQAKTAPAPSAFDSLVTPLSIQPTPQFAASAFLPRSLDNSFKQTSDSLPQLVSILKPAIAGALYQAWSNAITEAPAPPKIYAFKVKAAPFGSTAPPKQITDEQGKVIGSEDWPLAGAVTIGINVFARQLWDLLSGSSPSSSADSVIVELSVDNGNHPVSVTTNLSNTGNNIPFKLDNKSVWGAIISINDTQHTESVTFSFSNRIITTDVTITSKDEMAFSINGVDTVSPDNSIHYRGSNGDISIEYSSEFNSLAFSQQITLPANPATILDLDAQYDQIIAETPVVILRSINQINPPIFTVNSTKIISKTAYNINGKSTELVLDKEWLTTNDRYLSDISDTMVYAQSEELQLSEFPILPMDLGQPDVIKGDIINLRRIYDGLESGRWIIVSGQSPGPASIKLSELAMISKVSLTEKLDRTQLTLAKPLAYAYEPGTVSIVTSTDIQGDTIVLQQLYDGLQSGRWLIVSGERTDVIVNNAPVAGINDSELAMIAAVNQASAGLPGDKVHTTLTLAKPLAHSYKLESVFIFANVVKATHGETRHETLGAGDSSKPLQAFSLKQPPLTFVPASNPAGVNSTLKVYVNDVEWKEADSLSGLGAKDRVFVSETDDADKTTITFGNGKQGARLPTGLENIKAIYRNGIGKPGNVKAGQITQLLTRPLGVKAITNPLEASEGADKETRDQARENAPLAVQALDRLVSVTDYADFTRTFAGIGKAVARKLSDRRRELVHVTIAGADDIPIDQTSDLYLNLLAALRQLGDPDLALEVAARELIVLTVSASIRLVSGYLWEPVKANITTAILDAFGFQRRALAQPALLCELIALIQNISGVEYVDVDKFNGIFTSSADNGFPTLAQMSQDALNPLVDQPQAYIPANVANIDKKGVMHPAQLAIFTPSVPDTIVLNPIS